MTPQIPATLVFARPGTLSTTSMSWSRARRSCRVLPSNESTQDHSITSYAPEGRSMLTEEQRRRGAEDILRAERERKPIQQLSKTFPDMEIEDAYRIQDLWAEGRVANGARVIGHKIGLTSRAMQMASKMTEPDYGRILDDAMYNDGAQIRADNFLKPRLEVELAFIMGEDLEGPGARVYEVM